MKRENFSLSAIPASDSPGEPNAPTLRITYGGPTASLRERLTDTDGSIFDGADIDVAVRKRKAETGILSIAERLTGTFICELDADMADVQCVVDAAETNDDRYRVEIVVGKETIRFEKRTLLVYDVTGQLLRSCSLIPGSVEL